MATTVLCILDGFGLNPRRDFNAVALAHKPVIDGLMESCPWSTLTTFGEAVGLPAGQMGNSEVGHLNIGAGRVVEQWLLRVARGLESTHLSTNPSYRAFFDAVSPTSALHLVGLFSDGGVHSHFRHLLKFLDHTLPHFGGKVFLHLITDGRDTAPNSALPLLSAELPGLSPRCQVASICGRFYAMDRDKRWERTERAYRAFRFGDAPACASPIEWLQSQYAKGVTDEFIEPAVFCSAPIEAKDQLVFWNFREDRMRQIVAAFAKESFEGFTRGTPPHQASRTLCFTDYDPQLGLQCLFHPVSLRNHLGEFLACAGKTQLRVAETEKYAHVTYFFNGGVEPPFSGETRELVPSPRDVATYDLKPEMSATAVSNIVCKALREQHYDLIVVNFANCDMVGHTGVLPAAVKAVEAVDESVGRIVTALSEVSAQALFIADHGNAEQMVDYTTGVPHTAHTTFPVPCILFGRPDIRGIRAGGALCDVAPTLLELMNLTPPAEMTGCSLLER